MWKCTIYRVLRSKRISQPSKIVFKCAKGSTTHFAILNSILKTESKTRILQNSFCVSFNWLVVITHMHFNGGEGNNIVSGTFFFSKRKVHSFSHRSITWALTYCGSSYSETKRNTTHNLSENYLRCYKLIHRKLESTLVSFLGSFLCVCVCPKLRDNIFCFLSLYLFCSSQLVK